MNCPKCWLIHSVNSMNKFSCVSQHMNHIRSVAGLEAAYRVQSVVQLIGTTDSEMGKMRWMIWWGHLAQFQSLILLEL